MIDRKPLIERHIQTVLLSVITAGIIFGASQLFNLSNSMVEVKTKLETLMAQSQKFITFDQVSLMSAARDRQLTDFDKRVVRLENDVDKIKDNLRKDRPDK